MTDVGLYLAVHLSRTLVDAGVELTVAAAAVGHVYSIAPHVIERYTARAISGCDQARHDRESDTMLGRAGWRQNRRKGGARDTTRTEIVACGATEAVNYLT
jgi:hypothetical protein